MHCITVGLQRWYILSLPLLLCCYLCIKVIWEYEAIFPITQPWGGLKYRWRAEEGLQAMTTAFRWYTFLGRPSTAWEKTIPVNLEVHLTDFSNCFLFRTAPWAQWTWRIHHWALTFYTDYWIINWALKNNPKKPYINLWGWNLLGHFHSLFLTEYHHHCHECI